MTLAEDDGTNREEGELEASNPHIRKIAFEQLNILFRVPSGDYLDRSETE